MAQQLTALDVSVDTFEQLYELANNIVDLLATVVITANNSANGALTTGNGYVSGIFGASTLVAPTAIRGGNVQSSANLNLTSNLVFGSNSIQILAGNSTANLFVNSTTIAVTNLFVNNATIHDFTLNGLSVGNSQINTIHYAVTNTDLQTIDSFSKASYRSAEYLVQMQDAQSNSFVLTRILLVHHTANAFITEYGTVLSNVSLGAFTATTNSTAVLLQLTPAVANVFIDYTRTVFTAA